MNSIKIQSINKVRPNNLIKYKISNSSDWENAKILSQAGKATGKFSNCWNIKNNTDNEMYIDLSKVQQYEILEETPNNSTTNNEIELLKHLSNLSLNEQTDHETIVHETLVSTNKAKQLEAKLKELSQWEQESVYDEIDDKGQECISLRWV